MTRLNKPTAEGVEVASRNFAEALMQDQLNTAIAALVAAISNQDATTTVDVSTGSPGKKIDYVTVNDSHGLLGDHSTLLVAQVILHAHHPSSDTAIEGSAQRASRAARSQSEDRRQVTQAGLCPRYINGTDDRSLDHTDGLLR